MQTALAGGQTPSRRQHAIDARPPHLETLRDLGRAQALGLAGGDLGGVDRRRAALVDAPELRGGDLALAAQVRLGKADDQVLMRSQLRSQRYG